MQKFYETVTDEYGNALANVSVSIFIAGTSTLAAIYEDDETTPKANPLSSNDLGLVQAKLPNGTYDIDFDGGDRITGYVASGIFDPANVAITGGTINGTAIGNTTPADATFNNANVNGDFNN